MTQPFLEQGGRTAFTKNKKKIPFLTFFGGKSQEDEGQLHRHTDLCHLFFVSCVLKQQKLHVVLCISHLLIRKIWSFVGLIVLILCRW